METLLSAITSMEDEERRWMVVGVCLTKVLTPALRNVLAIELSKWHQALLKPPDEIDKQTFGKHKTTLPPSSIKLNYESINNNNAHKSRSAFDYTVKNSLSLAKLFVKPFMASFTGFDQTMDTSVVLSVVCESAPFVPSGAAAVAKKVRSDVRNEWAHCDFSKWTEPAFQAAFQDMQALLKKVIITPAEQKRLSDELNSWKERGQQLCFGQPVDSELLKLIQDEVAHLSEHVKVWKEESSDQNDKIHKKLKRLERAFNVEMNHLKKETSKELDVLIRQFTVELSRISLTEEKQIPYVFSAPLRNGYFSGRASEIQNLRDSLGVEQSFTEKKVHVAAVCGLGGIGKTSLVNEFAYLMKDHYGGGVFWFTAEDDTKLEKSMNYVALSLGTFLCSFDATLTNTLKKIGQENRAWLIVVDCLDQPRLSENMVKILSGPWQRGVSGDVVVATRRKPSLLVEEIPSLDEASCIRLECFNLEDAKQFLLSRIGQSSDKNTVGAENLVEELGRLPLAIEQAGAYIKALDCNLLSYLEQYRAQRLQLLNEQTAYRLSLYESVERLAVHTTWLLNIEHIKKSMIGPCAIRFMNACSFLDPNEIEEELINIGEPPVNDEEFRKRLTTPLGCRQVLKVLTDFSLFKHISSRSVSTHRLVQEVVNENLNPKEKAESFFDAVRMLSFAFLKCSTPDSLMSHEGEDFPSGHSASPSSRSRFHMWSKLCLHVCYLQKCLDKFLESSDTISWDEMFFPETANVFYQRAVYLSANLEHTEAKRVLNFAYRVLDWIPLAECEVVKKKLSDNSLFPLGIPLARNVQRQIQYCCLPVFASCQPITETPSSTSLGSKELKETIKQTRDVGNKYFKQNRFKDALDAYSSGINISIGTDLFDPLLLTNRASVYLKLQRYDDALKDANDYILQCPCGWRGYARKALALDGLNEKVSAEIAAALAFYYRRDVFSNYEPFVETFLGVPKRVFVCDNVAEVSRALNISPIAIEGNSLKILVLGSNEYIFPISGFDLSSCVLVGARVRPGNAKVTLKFRGVVKFTDTFIATNIFIHFSLGHCIGTHPCCVKLVDCHFTCLDPDLPAFATNGQLIAESCNFCDCSGGGLLCANGGNAVVDRCSFSRNGTSGLEVRNGGKLIVKNSHMYRNGLTGLFIGSNAAECVVINCKLFRNESEGIAAVMSKKVVVIRSDIFDNGGNGIFIKKSSVCIKENQFFGNQLWGFWAEGNSYCYALLNKVFRNKVGGIRVGYRAVGEEFRPSVFKWNTIYNNSGPGIVENVNEFEVHPSAHPDINLQLSHKKFPNSLQRAEFQDNLWYMNEENKQAELLSHVCSYCRAKHATEKCDKCFTAEYCGKHCKKSHSKKHQEMCNDLLEKSSIIPVPKKSKRDLDLVNYHYPGLDPVGPKYSNPPQENGSRFLVKVQSTLLHPVNDETADTQGIKPRSSDEPNDILVYDRSLEFFFGFQSEIIYELVKEFGIIGQKKCEEKKLFLFALLERGKLRLFINEFAPIQKW